MCNNYNIAVTIVEKLQFNGYKAYFIGGAVRNKLLNYPIKDIDIVTSANPQEIKKFFKYTKNVGVAFGITVVIKKGIHYEIATFRDESEYVDGRHPKIVKYVNDPSIDAKRRDFTINALYYDPINKNLLDFGSGLSDIKNKILKTVGNPIDRFNEDYLRMFRAVRFTSELEFKMKDSLISSIKILSNKVSLLAIDRVREELNKMFISSHPDVAMQLLYDTNLMQVILPELAKTKGISQPKTYHPEGDVFEHIKLMLKNMVMPNLILAWSILLHDIGKPNTIKIDENGIEKFHCHADIGHLIAINILTRLNFSKKYIEKISYVVKNHMRFSEIIKMREAKRKRIMSSETFSIELELHRLDCISSNGITENFIYLLDQMNKQKGNNKLPNPLINGYDLLKIGLKRGPLLGNILKIIEEKQLENCIKTKEEAINFVIKNFVK